MKAYVEFEILEGAYEISCPDAQCPYQGIMDIEQDIATLASHDLLEKHKRFRLNRGKFPRKIEPSISISLAVRIISTIIAILNTKI